MLLNKVLSLQLATGHSHPRPARRCGYEGSDGRPAAQNPVPDAGPSFLLLCFVREACSWIGSKACGRVRSRGTRWHRHVPKPALSLCSATSAVAQGSQDDRLILLLPSGADCFPSSGARCVQRLSPQSAYGTTPHHSTS